MFAYIYGKILHTSTETIIIASESLGFEIFVPNPTDYKKNNTYEIYIHTHWNQEQGQKLYGFTTILERSVFNILLSCSGVGPKLAVSITKQISPTEFISTITQQNSKKLSSLQGIGPKKAQQLCEALQNKMQALLIQHPELQNQNSQVWLDLQETLQTLHYSPSEIQNTLRELQKELKNGGKPSLDNLLKKALILLSRR